MKVSVFLKYPQHVLITFILQSQIINHNIYINSSSHDPQWVSYRYLDKRKSPINGLFTPFMKLCLLFKLLGGEIYLAVPRYTFVHFILHIHLILHFCIPHLKFLEPKWSQFITYYNINITILQTYFLYHHAIALNLL